MSEPLPDRCYGDSNAPIYDQLYPRIDSDCLAEIAGLAGTGRVLELGVGTGRCAGPLARMGVDVVGIDRSAAMLSLARANYPTLPLVRADFSQLPFANCFRLAVSLVDTLSLLAGIEQLQGALQRIANVLEPDGLLIDESWRSHEDGQVPYVEHLDVPIVDATTGTAEARYQVRRIRMDQPAFDTLCAASGFELQSRHAGWSERKASAPGSGWISIYSKTHQGEPNRSVCAVGATHEQLGVSKNIS